MSPSVFLRLTSSPLFHLWISLGLTLSRYHIPGEECTSYPSNPRPVTAKLRVLTASLCCRVTWSFPRTRRDLWLRFGGWRCVCAALLFQESGAVCAAVLRIQEEFIQRGCSSQQKVALIASQRGKKITLDTFKDGGQRSNSKLTNYSS